MKQRRLNDKRRNAINMRNKRTAPSVAYKPIKPVIKDHQNSNYNNQTDNKDNNRNIDMSIGLREEKKLKNKTMDQKEEKPSSPKEAVTSSSVITYILTITTADFNRKYLIPLEIMLCQN